MWILNAVVPRRLLRVGIFSLLLSVTAVPAFAGPRLMRVIWDVGEGAIYYKAFLETERGHDRFLVPPDAAAATAQLFVRMTSKDILQKGDRVRLYVVNYNPVSHVWNDSSTVEQVEEAPSAVGPLVNALALALTGGAKPPSFPLNAYIREKRPSPPPTCDFDGVGAALDELATRVTTVGTSTSALVAEAHKQDLSGAAKKLAKVPTNSLMWSTFDDRRAWDAVSHHTQVFGRDFDTEFSSVEEDIGTVKDALDHANEATLALDSALANLKVLDSDCIDTGKAYLDRRQRILTFLQETAGPDSPIRSVVAQFEAAQSAWHAYEGQLRDASWTAEAIELIVKDPIKEQVVLRIDAVFGSPDKQSLERTQRSLVLGVQPDIPLLVISSGIAVNWFHFEKLQVSKTTVTGDDSVVGAKSKFETAADTTWERIVPIWIENIRIAKLPAAGIYGTFGTTPDRNIFKNAIVGGSVYVPRWRTVFTGGTIFARGYVQGDFDSVIKQFSDNSGFVLSDVTAENVPLPSPSFHASFFAAATFKLLAF